MRQRIQELRRRTRRHSNPVLHAPHDLTNPVPFLSSKANLCTDPSTPAIHPIVLHANFLVEEDDDRAPQTQFVAERQVAFLEALAVTGSVHGAARVSHQTCYRARRRSD
ncbi:hypothetical protein [Qipengyuania sp.]|uniref:hypothetical protein n=1 Tax=Qipengyuania sp. TaxID=2004515 RepID=UPI003BACEF0A